MPLPRTLDELCIDLGRLRAEAGTPSYAEIARRIGVLRGGDEPAKVTVYDNFRPGRRRIDPDLLHDIVRALGTEADEAEQWRRLALRLNGDRAATHIEVALGPRVSSGSSTVVGRDALLADLDGCDVVVLSGLPGVGKSTLATALVGDGPALTVELRESEPGRPEAGPVDVLRRMLGALGHRSLPYELARLRSLLAVEARGIPVVIEDIESPSRLAALLVPGIRYVITSRVDLCDLDNAPSLRHRAFRRVTVPPLTDDDARTLLTQLVATEPGAADASEIARVAAVAGGLPLDVVMLAAAVRDLSDWSWDDLAARFESESPDARLRPVLESAIAALSEEDAKVLGDASLVDRDVDVSVLSSVHGEDTRGSIERLAGRHLLELRDGHLRMHATVFAFVRERTLTGRAASSRREALIRMADATLAAITRDDGYAAREVGTVLALGAAIREHGIEEWGEQLALAAHSGLGRASLWTESMRLLDLAADAVAGDQIPDLALGIARCAEKLGRYDEALATLHRVRRTARGIPLARTWNQIGNVSFWISHYDEALSAYLRALALARSERNATVAGRALGNHANVLRVLARYRESDREFSEALAIALDAGDDVNIEIVRANRALLWIATGRITDAEDELTAIIAAAGARPLPSALSALAQAAEARGDFASATERCDCVAAADVDYAASADVRLLRARLDARAGRFDEAIDVAAQALQDADRAGSPLIATEAGNSLAEILVAAVTAGARPSSALSDAERYAVEAGVIAEAVGDHAEAARTLTTCAAISRLRGDISRADEFASRARSIYRRIGHRLGATSK